MNLRTHKRADLQSAAINHSAIPPRINNQPIVKSPFAPKVKCGITVFMKNKHKPPRSRQNNGKTPAHNTPKLPRPNLFGIHAVTEAIKNPDRKIKTVYITDKTQQEFETFSNITTQLLDKKDFDRLFPRDTVHQGVAAVTSDLPEVNVQDLVIRADQNALLLILDQVTDPHNVGAILRSASAFGAHGVIMQRKHAPELNGTLAKTACGAVEHIDVAYETNLARTIEFLQEKEFFVFGLDERGSQNISNLKKGGKTALVLGAEGSGLRRLVAEKCDDLVKLPTQGAIKSLNVSNAAAVALYALKF